MNTENKIQIMQAWLDGKQIQGKGKLFDNKWHNCPKDCEPSWEWSKTDYRIAPEPKYRPFSHTMEFLDAYRENGMLLKLIDNNTCQALCINNVNNDGITVIQYNKNLNKDGEFSISYDELLNSNKYEFTNNKKCGILINTYDEA